MSLCNYCQRKETRSRSFTLPQMCDECANKIELHNTNDQNLIFIDSNAKDTYFNENTEFSTTNDLSKTIINQQQDDKYDAIDYKDALLNSLYSQVEFLRNELSEKNILIKSLLLKESVFNRNHNFYGDLCGSENNDDVTSSSDSMAFSEHIEHNTNFIKIV